MRTSSNFRSFRFTGQPALASLPAWSTARALIRGEGSTSRGIAKSTTRRFGSPGKGRAGKKSSATCTPSRASGSGLR